MKTQGISFYFVLYIVAVITVIIWTPFFIFAFFLRLIKLIGAMRRAVQNKL